MYEHLSGMEQLPKFYSANHKNFYFLTEHIPGCAANKLKDRNQFRITESTRTYFAWQYCKLLAQLHSNRVTHGDVKPGNCVVDTTGSLFAIDFCGSIIQGDNEVYCGSGTITCSYAAPERYEDLITRASDIFSIGAVLFATQSPTLRSPICGLHYENAIKMANNASQTVAVELPAHPLKKLMASTLEKKPTDRPNISEVERCVQQYYLNLPGVDEALDKAVLADFARWYWETVYVHNIKPIDNQT